MSRSVSEGECRRRKGSDTRDLRMEGEKCRTETGTVSEHRNPPSCSSSIHNPQRMMGIQSRSLWTPTLKW